MVAVPVQVLVYVSGLSVYDVDKLLSCSGMINVSRNGMESSGC